MDKTFKGKAALITGSSRGIGRAIALKLAAAGADIIIVAKSVTEDPRLGGTIYSVAKEVEDTGARALPIACDLRDETAIIKVTDTIVREFGQLDILINNASAISLTPTEGTSSKQFDLIHDINVRGTFLMTKSCIPLLKRSDKAHILTLSPPMHKMKEWLHRFPAYALSKYNMSMLTLAWSVELAKEGIAVNSLWPETTIATAAIKNLLGGEEMIQQSRSPEIVALAASYILRRNQEACTGNLFLDTEVLLQEGITDLTPFAAAGVEKLNKDIFL